MPALFCETEAPFFRPFKILGKLKEDRSGGWMVGELTLEGFYNDFLEGRNRWSHSNCGFDLARYIGTKLTLYPANVDYIFWYDTDYGNFNEFKTLVQHIHPAILINSPHTTVVLSKETLGRYRPRRVWIPPPTIYGNRWATQSDWAQRGLAIFAISVIDFKFPWIHPGTNFDNPRPYDMYDYTGPTGRNKQVVKNKNDKFLLSETWWNNKTGSSSGRADVWYAQWPGWTAEMGALQATVYDAIALGPFVKKQQYAECQVCITYRSYWKWGGDILTMPERVCDPATGSIPKSLKGGEPCDPRLILTKEDVGKDGYIKPEKWALLIDSPTKKSRFSHQVRREESSEEEKNSQISDAETSEIEPCSSEGSRRPRRRVDGGRIRELFRLRDILNQIAEQRRRSM